MEGKVSTFDKVFLGAIAVVVGMIVFPILVYLLRKWWKWVIMGFTDPV